TESGSSNAVEDVINTVSADTESGSSNAVEDVINTVSADTESGSSNAVEDVINTVSADTESGTGVEQVVSDAAQSDTGSGSSNAVEDVISMVNNVEDREVILEGFKISASDEIKDRIVERISDADVKGEEINIDKSDGFEIQDREVTKLIYVGTDEDGDKVFEFQSGDQKIGEATFDINDAQNKVILEDVKINFESGISYKEYGLDSFYSPDDDSIKFDNIQKISSQLNNLKPGDSLEDINIRLNSGKNIEDLRFLGENGGRYIFDSNQSGSEHIIFEPEYSGEDLQEIKVVRPNESDIRLLNRPSDEIQNNNVREMHFDEPGRKGDVITEVGDNSLRQTVDMQLSGKILEYSNNKSYDLYELLQNNKIKNEAKLLDFMIDVKKEFSGNGTLEDIDKNNWSGIFKSFKKNPNSPVLKNLIEENMMLFVSKLQGK
ncbi:MAG: hypothetical protein PHZ07_03795, partial [Patescibacteria group bacterium]|nr:hypothetical protein [Patescibacteria group bacterium]